MFVENVIDEVSNGVTTIHRPIYASDISATNIANSKDVLSAINSHISFIKSYYY